MNNEEYQSNLDHAKMRHKYYWRVGVYIEDPDLARRIRVCAAEDEINYSELVILALTQYLERRDMEKEKITKDARVLL